MATCTFLAGQTWRVPCPVNERFAYTLSSKGELAAVSVAGMAAPLAR
jgi:hypothetical protein